MTIVRLLTEDEYRDAVTRLEGYEGTACGDQGCEEYEALLASIDLWEEQHESLQDRSEPKALPPIK